MFPECCFKLVAYVSEKAHVIRGVRRVRPHVNELEDRLEEPGSVQEGVLKAVFDPVLSSRGAEECIRGFRVAQGEVQTDVHNAVLLRGHGSFVVRKHVEAPPPLFDLAHDARVHAAVAACAELLLSVHVSLVVVGGPLLRGSSLRLPHRLLVLAHVPFRAPLAIRRITLEGRHHLQPVLRLFPSP